jgi:hypothetical protein
MEKHGWPLVVCFRNTVTAFCLACAIGCEGSPRSLEDLEPPAYAWTHSTGLCSSTRATDAKGVVWTESGCEATTTGWHKVATVSFDAVAAAFAALPPAAIGVGLEACLGNMHHFSAVTEAGVSRRAAVCGSGNKSDASDLPEPYKAAAAALGL